MRVVDSIIRILNEKRITKYKLTKDCNMPHNIFTYWESGKQKPNFDTLLKIADYLNVSLDYLIGRNISINQNNTISNNAAINPIISRISQLSELQQIQVMAYIDGLQGVKSHTTQIDTRKLVSDALDRGIAENKTNKSKETKIG